jgi:hypothetical protein
LAKAVRPEGLDAFVLQLRRSSFTYHQYAQSSLLVSLQNHLSQWYPLLVKGQ